MKRLFIVTFLFIPAVINATTYYVSTTGNNDSTGTIGSPWLTLQKGFSTITAGDTLYIRGGTYYPVATTFSLWGTNYVGVGISSKNGTSINPITVLAFPGERPVLDCSSIESLATIGIMMLDCNYWHLKGLEVKNANQIPGGGAAGIWLHSCNSCTLEQLVTHNNGGSGLRILWDSENNLILNCDSYQNKDPYTIPIKGDNSDGIEIAFIQYRAGNPRVNTVIGCRAWSNSDDGFDGWDNEGIIILDKYWAWGNGIYHQHMGVGSGIKVGQTQQADEGFISNTVTNCISANNDEHGFTSNGNNKLMRWYNNTSYHNRDWGYSLDGNTQAYILRNNISYQNRVIIAGLNGSSTKIIDHNTWNGVAVSDADFVSLDTTEMSGARKADGSLPDINFLHLALGSYLIDAGIDVGLPFNGSTPDLGAFEFTGINNHHPSIMNQSFQIDENSPNGTEVGTVVASDPDAGQTLDYSIVSGNTDGAFAINASTGVLSVANSAAVNVDFALVVKVQDNGTDNLSNQATITINVIPTGVESTVNNSTIKVYPNPVSDELIIEIEGNNDRQGFEILNSVGNIVFKGTLSERIVVPTINFSPGIYIIKLENGKSFEFKKIIKL